MEKQGTKRLHRLHTKFSAVELPFSWSFLQTSNSTSNFLNWKLVCSDFSQQPQKEFCVGKQMRKKLHILYQKVLKPEWRSWIITFCDLAETELWTFRSTSRLSVESLFWLFPCPVWAILLFKIGRKFLFKTPMHQTWAAKMVFDKPTQTHCQPVWLWNASPFSECNCRHSALRWWSCVQKYTFTETGWEMVGQNHGRNIPTGNCRDRCGRSRNQKRLWHSKQGLVECQVTITKTSIFRSSLSYDYITLSQCFWEQVVRLSYVQKEWQCQSTGCTSVPVLILTSAWGELCHSFEEWTLYTTRSDPHRLIDGVRILVLRVVVRTLLLVARRWRPAQVVGFVLGSAAQRVLRAQGAVAGERVLPAQAVMYQNRVMYFFWKTNELTTSRRIDVYKGERWTFWRVAVKGGVPVPRVILISRTRNQTRVITWSLTWGSCVCWRSDDPWLSCRGSVCGSSWWSFEDWGSAGCSEERGRCSHWKYEIETTVVTTSIFAVFFVVNKISIDPRQPSK